MKAGSLILGILLGCFVTPPVRAADHCDGLSKLAKTIMGARQDGSDMSKLMAIADHSCDDKFGDDVRLCKLLQPLQRSLIVEAYEQPRFSSNAYQEKSKTDFANNVYLACYESEHKDSR